MEESERQRFELLVARFEQWLEAINYSAWTRAAYTRHVRFFITWLAAETDVTKISEVTPQHLQQYQLAIYNYQLSDGRPLSVMTQLAKLVAVRSFFNWLLREQQIIYNPAASLQVPKRPSRLPQVLSKAEMKQLLAAMPIEKAEQLRDRLIVELFYTTGMRLGELEALTIYDVDLAASTIKILNGKGQQQRIVPLTETSAALVKRYLTTARGSFIQGTEQGLLFVSARTGGMLSRTKIAMIIKRAGEQAGIEKRITPHMLRHSCATHLLKGRADIRQIQQLLGHRNLSTTEIYTQVEISDLRAMLQRCHPREKKKR